jgi:hypothetical protein
MKPRPSSQILRGEQHCADIATGLLAEPVTRNLKRAADRVGSDRFHHVEEWWSRNGSVSPGALARLSIQGQ